MTNLPLILASASPRRRQLLAEAGCKFEVVPSQIDESSFSTEGISPIEYAKQLALAKANDIAEKFPNHLVIGADTVVDFEGRIVGKPRDAKDAEAITRMLFSRPHKVITGVAIVCKARQVEIVDADTTVVYPKPLTDAQIAEHIKSGIWRDKAGAYAIQGHNPASANGYAVASDPFVEHIDGSMTNVMGMPMELLKRMLQKV